MQLVVTKNFLPYVVGDVITVTDEEWAAIGTQTPGEQQDLKINPLIKNCVVPYSEKNEDHVALLEAQTGTVAGETVEPDPAGNSAQIKQLQEQLAIETKLREEAEEALKAKTTPATDTKTDAKDAKAPAKS